MIGEKFIYTSKARKSIIFTLVLGFVIFSLGILIGLYNNINWIDINKRILTNLWINNVYFVGVSVIGVFLLLFNM
jgi:vacuolar-type H+-ATPase subunit I/STV1